MSKQCCRQLPVEVTFRKKIIVDSEYKWSFDELFKIAFRGERQAR